jgi:uncharacterized protein YbjT (DUF2867 family)
VLEFFEKSGRNLLAAERPRVSASRGAVGRRHRAAAESGYFRAKMAQENLIKASDVPYTIVRATQFFEFVGAIAQLSTQGNTVRLPAALFQPMASDDVAAFVAEAAVAEPVNGMIEVAGPEPMGLDEAARQFLSANHDPRTVTTDPSALYYGVEVDDRSLTPGDRPRLGPTRFDDWLSRSASQRDLAPAR